MAGRKVFYTIGGRGKKTVEDGGFYRNVAPGKFTKGSTNRKPILTNQTRINSSMIDITLNEIS
jgi:hypothetical protein